MAGGHSHTHHSHGHSHADVPDVAVGTASRVVLTLLLALIGAATVFGLVRYWPSSESAPDKVASADFAAPGVTFPVGTVKALLPPCQGGDTAAGEAPAEGSPDDQPEPTVTCGAITVALDPVAGEDLPEVSVSVPTPISTSGLRVDDKVMLMRIPASDQVPAVYSFMQVQRGAPLALMLALFVLVVALVARLRGMLALVGLGVGGLILVKFMLPALLEGQPGTRVAIIGSTAIMFVVLYLAHGLSIRTSTALAGTLFGVAITAGLGAVGVAMARLSGVADDEGATLASFVPGMSPRELLSAAIIVAGLGVLNDVTITQSSAVWELRAAAPSLSRRELYISGMRIGRDHIASTIYTIVFAYAGAALPVLLLLFLYDRPVLDLLQTESMSEEIVRTLASAIGLVLAVPATTAIAALAIGRPRPGSLPVPEEPDGGATASSAHDVPRPFEPSPLTDPRPAGSDLERQVVSGRRPPSSRSEARRLQRGR